MAQKCTVPAARDRKMSGGDEPLVMPTAYDSLGLYGAALAPSGRC